MFWNCDNSISKNSGQFLQVYIELTLKKIDSTHFNSIIYINQSATAIIYNQLGELRNFCKYPP